MIFTYFLLISSYFSEIKFPKFIKDKDLITLIKGMLTKNITKRILKLSQIKQSEYFKEFGWDALVSFNLDPCYNIEMPQENLNDGSEYSDYIQQNLKDFVPPEGSEQDLEYKQKVDVWFASF